MGKFLLLIAILSSLFAFSCQPAESPKKKVVYVNSYHPGHPSSDEIMAGVQESFPKDSFQLFTFIMDTKRNPSLEYIQERAAQINDSIALIEPDILIVSDDNAVKYLVQPYFREPATPVVFCGVNWSAQEYDLPRQHVTGMLEILPLADALQTMRRYDPSMQKLLVLTENTTTARKEEQLLDTLFHRIGLTATNQLVDNFEQWKAAFKEGNEVYDIIYIPTNGAIKNWDKDEAVRFVEQHIKIPVVTCEDFMMPYVVFGMTKVAREQGLWAAQTAKKILAGSSPQDFPITKNQKATVWINPILAGKIDFQPDSSLLSKARIVQEK